MKTLKATVLTSPPAWAVLERKLLDTLSEAALAVSAKYNYTDGMPTFVDDVDDVYESRAGRGLLYAMGGWDQLLPTALNEWNAVTRYFNDGLRNTKTRHPDDFAQLHREYYNLGQAFEWFHQGEGNQALYELGVADPTNPEHQNRATRFADMFTGDDPDVPNYDPEKRLLRSPFPSSVGPLHHAGQGWGKGNAADFANMLLRETSSGLRRVSLAPSIDNLEPDWFENPQRRDEVIALFDRLVLDGDTPTNLTATALVTHAFLHTGEERYRRWVLDYSEAWLERIRTNGGIVPDNVGPSGKIGEHRNGQWWGGLYGWNSNYAGDINFGGLTVAAECAVLLSGDMSYLDLLRSQLTMLLDNARQGDDGQLLIPGRYAEDGWTDFRPPRILEFAHLYHASMSSADRALIEQLRQGDKERDWNLAEPTPDRRLQSAEYPRFQYYDGQDPTWPEKILQAEHLYAQAFMETIRAENRDLQTLTQDNQWPPNPVVTKGLTQVTMGAPQTVYNGGLLRATVRHFDADKQRPGLPPDVAVLVDQLGETSVGMQFVNLSTNQTRTLMCQAGAFGEHEFGEVRYDTGDLGPLRDNPSLWLRENTPSPEQTSTRIDAPHFRVRLAPGMGMTLRAELRRFSQTPTYQNPTYA
ncbi:MAG: hypothetical protein HOC74_43530 [Gemmatimonadetes bacterium]|jgi:hypothetical protein|nr:hypothetical protein [Gemmatimonadota bacterium]